jgi:hypothetical protein
VAKYTNEDLNRIQEQYAELIEGPEPEPHQVEFDDEVRADEEGHEDESPPS